MEYRTVRGRAQASFIERKSEFIGQIAPVSCEEEALAFLSEMKAQHRRARHNVYAYLVRQGNLSRYSDDGEPQGTGGVPVLDVLQKESLTDVCVVVTRYFGGILLGTGGLVRAYSHACKLAVEAAQPVTYSMAQIFTLTASYALYGKLTTVLDAASAKRIAERFSDTVELDFAVRENQAQALCTALTDAANGQVSLLKTDKKYVNFER